MSKKTENIYQSITAMNVLAERLEEYKKNLFEKGIETREIEDIEFELKQQLKNLTFWFDSLYAYNGKSTSRAKKNASMKNGRKGGRPPKTVTLMKRRIIEINEVIIPELQHTVKFTDDSIEEENARLKLELAEEELKELEQKLSDYKRKK